jgi:hypothetical protein
MELTDETFVAVFEVGTKVRMKDHPEITGRITAHEIDQTSGKLHAIPYRVLWDDESRLRASKTWGPYFFFFAYMHRDLELA